MNSSTPEYIISIPLLVKAHESADGKRKISFEASNESPDLEGDVILQEALLGSAHTFLKGQIDLDHLSETGDRYGLNPQEYVIGRPTGVFDMGNGRTGVEGELFKGNKHADTVWEELNRNPPEPWKASIFGYPLEDGLVDVRLNKSIDPKGATRFLVKRLSWASVALTKSPVNDSIAGNARIIKSMVFAKAYHDHLVKGYGFPDTIPSIQTRAVENDNIQSLGLPLPHNANHPEENVANGPELHKPRNRVELMGHFTHHLQKGACPHNPFKKAASNSVYAFREHFMGCCGMDYHDADIHALALMRLLHRH